MNHTFMLVICLWLALLCDDAVARQNEKGNQQAKVSMVARASSVLRDYFRDMYAKTFTDTLNDTALNRVLDDQIDEFVKRLVQKNRRMEEAAAELLQADDPDKQRYWIRRVRDTAGDLEGTLRIWSDSLRPKNKIKEMEVPMSASTMDALVQEVTLYQRQIDRFLFPEEVAISVKELQSEGFHGTLKKIQRVAQALDREK